MTGRIVENLREVRDRIAAAAARSGRAPEAVRLVAVTKTVDEDAIRTLAAAGQKAVGENRAKQLRDRAAALADLGLEWHMIGRLQRKNVRYVVPAAAMIHSVDSVEVAAEIAKRLAVAATATGGISRRLAVAATATGGISRRLAVAATATGGISRRLAVAGTATGRPGAAARIPCLLEINSGEAQKAGVLPAEAAAIAAAIAALPGIDLVGLMTMAPLVEDAETVRPVFAALRELRDRLNRQAALPRALEELSMGMTQDYEAAVEEGATIVRVGTALFR